MRLRLLIALAAVLLFAGFGGSAQTSQPLLGLVSRSADSMALVRLDPLTLVPHGSLLALGDRYRSWSFAPDRSKVVFGDSSRGELLLVDAKRMRRIAVVDSVLQTASVVATSWPAADRVYAVVETLVPSGDHDLSCCGPAKLVTVDPAAHKLLATRPLEGQVYGVAHAAGELVLLVGPINALGAARLVVLGRDGGVRSFALDGVTVGHDPYTETETEEIEHFARPGFAVAADGSRAYLVTPGRVVEVDLATGAASSHALAPRRALQKVPGGYDGSWRSAAWARPGRLVVTGFDDHASIGADGHVKVDAEPAGAALVDTRDWSMRVVDATATYASVGSGALVVSGVRPGATIYGLDGSRRARLFGRQFVDVVALGHRAFVQTQAGYYAVVSLRTGAILRKVRAGEMPQPLLGAGADS
ncbi:MAG TPA: hypothetical protein VE596_19510 [Gaiellaceae bacterium]|jgi:hypothetical protein|nr:hypothetical protein [Gaiellaceae bacterium]